VERLRGELELVQGLALSDPLTGMLNRRGLITRCSASATAALRLHAVDPRHRSFQGHQRRHGHLLGTRSSWRWHNVLRRLRR